MGDNGTTISVNTNDPNANVNVGVNSSGSSSSSSSSSSSNTVSFSTNPTDSVDMLDEDYDSETTLVNPPPPAVSTTSGQQRTPNPALQRLTQVLIVLVIAYVIVFVAIRLFYPSTRKARAMAGAMNRVGRATSGERLGPNGEIGYPCGTSVHRMKWVPRYGWLVDINKEFCKPRVGLCNDPTGEIPNKWCSYSCRLNLNSQTANGVEAGMI